jgi:NAD(P)-dependent dehydrogenase (short-subunit alcohol dehydrogenase family)
MMFSLQGKTAIVTGAGSGIGRAIALTFAKQGARVILFDISESSASAVGGEIRAAGGESRVVVCDVTDAAAVKTAFEAVDAIGDRIDILVNNAGIAHVGSLLTTDEQAFERVYRVNVKGVYLCSKASVERMQSAGGGVILNMASIASLIGLEDRFAYSMSKGAVLTMTRSIAIDYMAVKIRCNCICPARIHTPFVDEMLKKYYPGREAAVFEELSKSQPIGRMGRPDEVAALALYLCSDEAAFITGQAFPIDGGVVGTPSLRAKERNVE